MLFGDKSNLKEGFGLTHSRGLQPIAGGEGTRLATWRPQSRSREMNAGAQSPFSLFSGGPIPRDGSTHSGRDFRLYLTQPGKSFTGVPKASILRGLWSLSSVDVLGKTLCPVSGHDLVHLLASVGWRDTVSRWP